MAKKNQASNAGGALFAVLPGAATKPTPNQVETFVVNALAYCSGVSATAINKDWVLGPLYVDASGDRHPGAGLTQAGIDNCFTNYLNQFITHFGSKNTIPAGTYSPTSKVSDVATDVSGRI